MPIVLVSVVGVHSFAEYVLEVCHVGCVIELLRHVDSECHVVIFSW